MEVRTVAVQRSGRGAVERRLIVRGSTSLSAGVCGFAASGFSLRSKRECALHVLGRDRPTSYNCSAECSSVRVSSVIIIVLVRLRRFRD